MIEEDGVNLEDYRISCRFFPILHILKINGADTAISRGNIQDPVVIILPYKCYVYYLI